MGEFLLEFGLFLAKAVTVVACVAAIVLLAFGLSRRGHPGPGLTVDKLNDRYRSMALALRKATLTRAAWRRELKQERRRRKIQARADSQRRRLFVLDFKGDIRATGVASLREEVSAILRVATPHDEVVVRLENFGGAVHDHGLAASQLQRVRAHGIPLTVAVDKGAASGGYLMACVADRIIAAPFAVIGSIGVIAQLPNFHRLLQERGVDFEQVTAGRYKRTLTMFGRNTEEDRVKLRDELEEIHGLFKSMVVTHRPALNIEAVATGEHWYGTRALELGLVDALESSDDYLLRSAETADVLRVCWRVRPNLQRRVLSAVHALADGFLLWASQRNQDSRYR